MTLDRPDLSGLFFEVNMTATPLIPFEPKVPVLPSDNLLGAGSDSDALGIFLNKSGTRSAETLRRYERETTRLTAFLYLELGISYRDVKLNHLQSYLRFVQNLPEHWLAPGILPGQPDRVLFRHSVESGKSTDQIIDVLSSFFSFLEKSNYVSGNPASLLVRSGEKVARGHSVVRFFHSDQWHFLLQCLASMPLTTNEQRKESYRTSYIFSIGYALALRESELTNHSCHDIYPDDDGGYFLDVLGKGRKRRKVPINLNLQNRIKNYRTLIDCEGFYGDDFPLAPKIRSRGGVIKSLSTRGLRFWWSNFMDFCQSRSTPEMEFNFQDLPFHTLRHTALTHLARKMDIEDLAIFAGHDSINTTSQYYHAEASRLKMLSSEHYI